MNPAGHRHALAGALNAAVGGALLYRLAEGDTDGWAWAAVASALIFFAVVRLVQVVLEKLDQ